LSAVADERTLFDCDTSPSSPLLSTRTGELSFEAPCWNAPDSAIAACSFFASWPTACVPEPPWACSADWPVRFRFPAPADESTLFDCSTEPPSPLLSTRTGACELPPEAQPHRSRPACCDARDAAMAACSFFASCPIACVPPEAHLQSEPDCVWSASCERPFRFAAVAWDSTLFDCVTSPSSPLLSTRTGVIAFHEPDCSAPEMASAP
jgi:hypothetical protein